ncbi:hypothetical protein DPEC_G00245810 [Dallia pectoralis]|uniref:Uncharacterized protein n=1 Tax=Dallia pectoralis TaxID=75939 RepID=A0ACC2FWD2_DALPE|nr:hypothetical protein DPEC_G00245810 [Dallia pectoralis]
MYLVKHSPCPVMPSSGVFTHKHSSPPFSLPLSRCCYRHLNSQDGHMIPSLNRAFIMNRGASLASGRRQRTRDSDAPDSLQAAIHTWLVFLANLIHLPTGGCSEL